MAEISYFFDNDDVNVKEYLSKDFANMIEIIAGRGDGYIKGYYNELQVTANGTLNITIGTGAAIVNGRIYINDTPKILQVTQGGTYQYRVMLKLDLTTKKIEATLRGGSVAPNPMMDKKANVYEISIAKIMYRGGTTILQTDIIDERNDNTVCGRLYPLGHTLPSLTPKLVCPSATILTDYTQVEVITDVTPYNLLFINVSSYWITVPVAEIGTATNVLLYYAQKHLDMVLTRLGNKILAKKAFSTDPQYTIKIYAI